MPFCRTDVAYGPGPAEVLTHRVFKLFQRRRPDVELPIQVLLIYLALHPVDLS